MNRKFSSISIETTLATGISNTATTMTVSTGTGASLLGGVTLSSGNVDQFTVALDPDTQNEEIVFVTGVSSDTLTIQRGKAGSSNISHSAGATVRHVLTSDDLTYFNSSSANNLTPNAQTGTTYTFALTDTNLLVTASNTSAQTYSIPTNANVEFPIGSQINIIQINTGQVTIQAATSATTTVLSNGTTVAAPKLTGRYSAATLIKFATDSWYVIGDIV